VNSKNLDQKSTPRFSKKGFSEKIKNNEKISLEPMPQILDNNGQPALLPFKGNNNDGESTMLRIMSAATALSAPIIDMANEISPLGDETMRFINGLDLGKNLPKIKNGEKILKNTWQQRGLNSLGFTYSQVAPADRALKNITI
jgi:hypothetical protein